MEEEEREEREGVREGREGVREGGRERGKGGTRMAKGETPCSYIIQLVSQCHWLIEVFSFHSETKNTFVLRNWGTFEG